MKEERGYQIQELAEAIRGMKSLRLIRKTSDIDIEFYSIKDTKYIMVFRPSTIGREIIWREKSEKEGLVKPQNDSFEFLLGELPKESQEEFIYHLDLFKNF